MVLMLRETRELNVNSICTQQFAFAQVDDLFQYAKFITVLFPWNKFQHSAIRNELNKSAGIKKPQLVGLIRYNTIYSVLLADLHPIRVSSIRSYDQNGADG